MTRSRLPPPAASDPEASRAETYIRDYGFPASVERGVRRRYPELSAEDYERVEHGLRQWLICCAWRDGARLAMPSRVADEAWHALILDTEVYTEFCEHAYGEYLHHFPEPGSDGERRGGIDETIRAWDSSRAGNAFETVLWGLDRALGISDPLGVSEAERLAVRAGYGGGMGKGGLGMMVGDLGLGDLGIDGGGGCGGGD